MQPQRSDGAENAVRTIVEIARTSAVSTCTPVASLAATLGGWANRQFAGALKPIGLRPRHLRTLVELRAGSLPQQALGDAVGIDPTQLVGLLNDLESEDLVERRRDPLDRRRHIVDISELGRAKLAEADRALAEVDDRMMAGLTTDERTQFVALMRYVTEHGAVDACSGKDEPCDAIEAAEDGCPGAA